MRKIEPREVLDRLARHLLVDGFHIVLDLEKSRGSYVVDARTGEDYLDLYSFFSSAPLGINPPGIVQDDAFMATLAEIGANKPANSDVYTTYLAEFVETFKRVLGDPQLPHLFFVEGGSPAVENALKCAFDWKSKHNETHRRSGVLGGKVLHLTRAFHGRTGYTLSLTNTDPVKTERFPTFDWPRIEVPAVRFPFEPHRVEVEQSEARALDQANAAFKRHPHDIACFIAEPIQGEGGDNHMRAEFLQEMQRLCHENDALFVLDEVQTGGGITGAPWAYQQLGLEPDIVAFAKKVQLGGIMAGRRVDEVPDNVFRVSGRLNSTWGGGLVDMVRSQRLLEIMERDLLIPRAGVLGVEFLGWLRDIESRHPTVMSNSRGRGLMCAFDLPSHERRTETLRLLRDERLLCLPCGERSIRFRPALSIGRDELRSAAGILDRVLDQLETGRS